MSYASVGALGLEPYCGAEEILDAETLSCVALPCPPDHAAYYGVCLTPEEQGIKATEMCKPYGEIAYLGQQGCYCHPGYVRSADPSGKCVPEASLPPGAPRGPAARPATATAAVLADKSGLELVALGAAVAGAGMVAWYYLGG